MPSPFPGMNPYLERPEVWSDFHERFIAYAAELLSPQVRPTYIVKINEHVYIHELPADERRLAGKGDVLFSTNRSGAVKTMTATNATAPAYARVPYAAIDEERLAFIEVRDRDTREIVTAIELLSPSNKGSDRQQYLAKRLLYLQNGVRLVEIDLLRGGARLPFDDAPACDYYAMVGQPDELPRVAIWPIQLREVMPTITIPLREKDHNAALNLQEVLNRVYDAAGYADYVYEKQPQPQLTEEDARWARGFVPEPSAS